MTDCILVPIDGSDPSREALEYALEEFPDADVVVCHAVRLLQLARDASGKTLPPHAWEAVLEQAERRAEELCEEAQSCAQEHGEEVETETAVGPPVDVILDLVDERDADHVVIGSHGRTGIERILLGSVAERVLRQAPVPVTIVSAA